MTVPNSPGDDERATAGLLVRPMRPADIDDGLRLCRAAGWNQLARDWTQFLGLASDGARVAMLDGRIVGTVATSRYEARFGWIGMVLVDPAVRGRGIGTRLLDEGLMLLADLPLAGLDATPAGYGLYVKRGFTEQTRLRRMRATIPQRLESTAHSSARPMQEADMQDVLALDRAVFGADRAVMLRWMCEGAPEYAWTVRENGILSGYMLGRHGYLFEHLGPIVAASGDAAADLTAGCLHHHAGREFIVDAVPHTDWLQSLEEIGFQEQRPLIRMTRGSGSLPGDPSRLFAILGPEFG